MFGAQTPPRARLSHGLLAGRLAVVALGLLVALPALAQPKRDPDWPCVQPRTATISLAAVWAGPDLASAGPWTDDQDAATLAHKLASRRTALTEVGPLLDSFVKEAGPEAKTRLLHVFAGVFEIINTERSQILEGITRYAKGQQRLADRLRDESDQLSAAKDLPEAKETPETKVLEEKLAWDTRIFDERAHSLKYVCESPVILEQRVFEISRQIQARL